ncbi:ankyrin repeat domain-containing protein [Motiliproteus coralliicola]|uniref:Ankyrin repeat domain-containing protein n=1 Tax=Motiliproteus coralliicola TaxID=2283196 RepID=A0A369W8R6_9GAMM|nr:ankyrin repeat domain-containing protein [Motiliproteus coralliicola]RDE18378.1 ankyrin repeat domain-containing protein [Motiliproteus coralliicola]
MRILITALLLLSSLFNVAVGEPAAAERADYLRAAAQNNIPQLQRSLALGVPVDSRDKRGRTALLIATHHNAVESARLLIAAGADVNAKDDLQDSPYLYAGAEGRLEILKMTVAAGADLSSVNRYGGTALTPAAHHGHIEVVRYLLTTEIDIDQINHLGWTALLEAVILGDGGPTYQQIVALLLAAGADRSIADPQGRTALDNALLRDYSELIELLQD